MADGYFEVAASSEIPEVALRQETFRVWGTADVPSLK